MNMRTSCPRQSAKMLTARRIPQQCTFQSSRPKLARCGRPRSVLLHASASESRFITANGCKVHVRLAGDGTNGKPPVLLLHGFPDTGAMWDKQVPALTAAGYKLIIPDLPGLGQSDKPSDQAFYQINNIVGTVLAVLDELKINKFILVGHDWGSAVAWITAFTIPDRIEKLVVMSVGWVAGLYAADPSQRLKSWYSLFFLFPEAEEVLMANDWALWRELMAGQKTEEQLQESITRLSKPGALTAGLSYYRANASAQMYGATQPLPAPGGKTLGMPVLGMWATGDDKYCTEAGMQASSAVVAPGKWRYERVEASSHWMMLVEPEKTSKLLLEFFNESS